MPDYEWKCAKCGEINPPYTEACRSCYSAPVIGTPPEPASKAAATTAREKEIDGWHKIISVVWSVQMAVLVLLIVAVFIFRR
jgi:uncharacterized membrane protein YvbJ